MSTSARLPTPELSAEDVRARIIWENEHLVIWDKPSGLPVHPGFGGGVTLDDYLSLLKVNAPDRNPGLLHRLDRETSGCLALGRSDAALKTYGKFFQTHRIEKTYLALVFGSLPANEGVIELPIRQQRVGAGMRSEVNEKLGQEAITSYRVLSKAHGMSVVEAKPKTGRMHQIRVHLAALGCPLAGDRLYGGQDARFTQLMLHAQSLALPSSTLAAALELHAQPPNYWRDYLPG